MNRYFASVPAFKAKVAELAVQEFFARSVFSIRDGAGVFDSVFGGGQYPRVLEIGTYRGISTAYLAGLCERVTTIDLVEGRLEQLGQHFDRRAFWRQLAIDNIDLHLVKDDAEKAALIEQLDFDLAFIDGGKNDIAQDFALVRRCGAVLFHDVDRRGEVAFDAVIDFVESLPPAEVQVMDIFALWRARHHG